MQGFKTLGHRFVEIWPRETGCSAAEIIARVGTFKHQHRLIRFCSLIAIILIPLAIFA
jgi:hypothetical protein